MFPDFVPHTPLSSPKIPFHMRHDLCSKIMRVKLAHNGHDIAALAITFKNGECGVEVTIEWLEGVVEKKKKFGMPYGIFCSQNDAESWGLLPHCIGSMLASRTLKLSLPFTDDLLFLAPSIIPSAIHRQAPFGISCTNHNRGKC